MARGTGAGPGVADPDAVVVRGRASHRPIVPASVPEPPQRRAVTGLVSGTGLTRPGGAYCRRPRNDRFRDGVALWDQPGAHADGGWLGPPARVDGPVGEPGIKPRPAARLWAVVNSPAGGR